MIDIFGFCHFIKLLILGQLRPIIRPFIKWFLRKTTRLCELQRICYGDKPGAARTGNVERSLMLSRNFHVRKVVSIFDELVESRCFTVLLSGGMISEYALRIAKAKKINLNYHCAFVLSLRHCMQQIWNYRILLVKVEDLRKTQYDSFNMYHETKLLKLWSLLVPFEELENRVTKQWQYIGFQGDDPKTDFRGMGLLGLENLLFFAQEYPQAASHVLSHSHHPQYGYTFAIVGINMTSLAYNLLKDGSAKTYMYNAKSFPEVQLFHRFYCYLFCKFDRLWRESKPQDMMDFSQIFDKFKHLIEIMLKNPASSFKIDVEIDTVDTI